MAKERTLSSKKPKHISRKEESGRRGRRKDLARSTQTTNCNRVARPLRNDSTTSLQQGRPRTARNIRVISQELKRAPQPEQPCQQRQKMTHGDHGHRGEPPDESSRTIKEKTGELADRTRQCPHSVEDRAWLCGAVRRHHAHACAWRWKQAPVSLIERCNSCVGANVVRPPGTARRPDCPRRGRKPI